jgi:inositol 3-alpha-galactosyltransferase
MESTLNRDQCWVTLVTQSPYLAGAVVLAHSLDRQQSKYQIVVMYTTSPGEEGITVLETEARRSGRIISQKISLLLPPKGQENASYVADQFKDTFTKLRAFEVYKLGYKRVAFLDADMAVFENPDDIFEHDIPGGFLSATHVCVCNIDSNP